MNQFDAAAMTRRLMNLHGLQRWTFAFNRRKRGMGLCRFDDHRIELSIHYVLANDKASVQDTVLHEIAHALAGPAAGHGPKWKRMCERLGAEPKRCGEARMPRGPWRAKCPHCGLEHHRHRKPLQGRNYYCRPCGPTLGPLHFHRHAAMAAQTVDSPTSRRRR